MNFNELTNEQQGWYITGFADGESYFIARPLLRKTKKGYSRVAWQFRWGIQVRIDDSDIINCIASYFENMGCKATISNRKRKGDISAQVTLTIEGAKNCSLVKEHFDKFPLLAKKKNDFEVWKDILELINNDYIPNDKNFFREYSIEEIEQRSYICSLCDKMRIGRLETHKELDSYLTKFLDYLVENKVINNQDKIEIENKYRVMI